MSNAESIHKAMADLRKGKITPDDFRAIMRASRKANGEQGHDLAKFKAVAAFNRA